MSEILFLTAIAVLFVFSACVFGASSRFNTTTYVYITRFAMLFALALLVAHLVFE